MKHRITNGHFGKRNLCNESADNQTFFFAVIVTFKKVFLLYCSLYNKSVICFYCFAYEYLHNCRAHFGGVSKFDFFYFTDIQPLYFDSDLLFKTIFSIWIQQTSADQS